MESLIFPIKYCGDTRPYFTIYDSDFKDYKENENLMAINSPIIGVINPICVRAFDTWPVLHFDDIFFQDQGYESNPTKTNKKENLLNDTLDIPNINKKRFVMQMNKALVKTFLEQTDEGYKTRDKLNMFLRMYLIELNNDFMRTFEEYFFIHEISHIRRISMVKSNFSIFEIFNKDKFIKYLDTKMIYFNLKYINDKKKTIELYSMFIKTKCFNSYLNSLLQRIKKLKK